MASNAILAGLGIAAIGFAGRYLLKVAPEATQKLNEVLKALPKSESFANSKYYKGGFEPKMTRREASLILGTSQSASRSKIKFPIMVLQTLNQYLSLVSIDPETKQTLQEAHKKIITLNHPDRGGSPYLAAKINQAKDLLEQNK